MASWREVAASRLAAPQAPDVPTLGGLGEALSRNLLALEGMAPPPLADRQAWQGVVADALRIAREGWAERALALGWAERDLFGVGPKDSWEFAGLAVWLEGRTLLLLDERSALAVDAKGNRATFHRGGWGHGRDTGLGSPVPLWRFGRG